MKRVSKLISILSLVTLILVGCSSSDENNAQKVTKEFGTELYTVDSKKIDDYNAMLNAGNSQSIVEKMKSNDKTLISLMTEDGYKTLINNKENILYTQCCTKGNYTIEVTDFTLDKNSYDIKENKAGYYFVVKLKFTSSKDKTVQTDVGQGYIGLSKENGQWKVFVYKSTALPALIKETLNK